MNLFLNLFLSIPFHFHLAQTPITEDGIAGVEYLKDGISQLIKLIDEVVDTHKAWGILEQTRGGIGPGFQHSINESFEHKIKIMCVKIQKSCMGNWNEWNRQPHNH